MISAFQALWLTLRSVIQLNLIFTSAAMLVFRYSFLSFFHGMLLIMFFKCNKHAFCPKQVINIRIIARQTHLVLRILNWRDAQRLRLCICTVHFNLISGQGWELYGLIE